MMTTRKVGPNRILPKNLLTEHRTAPEFPPERRVFRPRLRPERGGSLVQDDRSDDPGGDGGEDDLAGVIVPQIVVAVRRGLQAVAAIVDFAIAATVVAEAVAALPPVIAIVAMIVAIIPAIGTTVIMQ